jgi:hypothetical protein
MKETDSACSAGNDDKSWPDGGKACQSPQHDRLNAWTHPDCRPISELRSMVSGEALCQAIDVLLMLASNAGSLVTGKAQKTLAGRQLRRLRAWAQRCSEPAARESRRFGHRPNLHQAVPRGFAVHPRVDQIPNTTDPTVPENAAEPRR